MAGTTTQRIAVDADAPSGRPVAGNLRIAVDFDGVLFDHVPYLLRGFRDAHGIDLAEEGLRYWDFFQYRAVRERNLTWQCVSNVLHAIDTDEAIHRLPPRDPHAKRVMRAWMDAGHEVRVVTARGEHARATTEAFLADHGIQHDSLVLGAARKTGYDVLVDDAPHNVLMAAADGGLALLMDQPYNRDVPTRRNPIRVRDWTEVERAVQVFEPARAA
jgi:5'-nucleotidase